MRVEFQRDAQAVKPYAVIYAPARTEEVEALIRRFAAPAKLTAFDERGETLLLQSEILRVYTEQRRIRTDSTRGMFTLRARLYELENQLDPALFVRISNGEIVNRDAIVNLDFSRSGTIRLTLTGGIETYVSRRYVSRIRKAFEG